jgi:Flp pilus assembly protein TadG
MSKPARRPSQRGAAAIEFGLLVLPLAIMTFGATEMGRAIYQYNTIGKTVRDAARFLATAPIGSTLAARCLALTGSPTVNGGACAGTPLVGGMTLAQVAACDPTICADHNLQAFGTPGTANAGVMNLVSVTITGYAFTSMVPFAAPSFTFGPIRALMPKPI